MVPTRGERKLVMEFDAHLNWCGTGRLIISGEIIKFELIIKRETTNFLFLLHMLEFAFCQL
jgi:hypothetical protein